MSDPTTPRDFSKPITLKLRKPIQFGQETIAELTFRPSKAKDFRGVKADRAYPFDFALELAGRLSGQTRGIIDELSGDDLEEVIEIVNGFTPGGQPTGGEP